MLGAFVICAGRPWPSCWQYQLQGARTSSGACDSSQNPGGINVTITGTSFTGSSGVSPVVFDIDHQIDQACDTSPPQYTQNTLAVQQLHARGAKAVGYVDAGTWEAFRQDAAQFDAFDASCGRCLYGRTLSGFHDEKWLDIAPGATGINPNTGQPQDRQAFILDQMRARVALVKADGFDAVEFDNVQRRRPERHPQDLRPVRPAMDPLPLRAAAPADSNPRHRGISASAHAGVAWAAPVANATRGAGTSNREATGHRRGLWPAAGLQG